MNWHRLFGLMLSDFFTGSPYVVELEKDLSLRQQYLDVAIIRKTAGTFHGRLPDGLDNLVDHNLLSFKSYQEAFDSWAMKELLGHAVNYRKQVSPEDALLPEKHFGLYGVCARFPQQLAAQVELITLQAGVLECRWGTDIVRLIVLRDLPREEHNAPLHLFSAVREQVQYGQGHYGQRSPNTSSLLQGLLMRYQQEGIPMPYTMEDYRREVREEVLSQLTPEERLEGLSANERLAGLSTNERLAGLSTNERLAGLSAAEREKLLETLLVQELKRVTPADVKKLLEELKNKPSNNADS